MQSFIDFSHRFDHPHSEEFNVVTLTDNIILITNRAKGIMELLSIHYLSNDSELSKVDLYNAIQSACCELQDINELVKAYWEAQSNL